jgi:hypothetical protein
VQRGVEAGHEVGELGQEAGQLAGVAAETGPQVVRGHVLAEVGEGLDEGLVGDPQVLLAAAVEDGAAGFVDSAGEFGGQPGLADACLPAHEQAAATASGRLLPRPGEQLELGRPAGEAEGTAGTEQVGEGQTGGVGGTTFPADLHGGHRLGQALEFEHAHGGEGVAPPASGQHPHDVGGQDPPPLGGGA